MQCDEFETRLHEVLDARRAPEQDLILCAHAEQCCSCQEDLVISGEILLGLELAPPFAISDSFAAGVVAQVHADQPTTRQLTTSSQQVIFRAAVAVLAATLLCVLAIVAPKFAGQSPMPNGDALVVIEPENGNPVIIPEQTPELVEAPSTHYREILELVATRFPPVESLGPGEELTSSLRPFSVAIEALRKAIPSPRPAPPTEEKPQAYWGFEQHLNLG